MKLLWKDNVNVELSAGISNSATSITVYAGVSPWNTPPAPQNTGASAAATLIDSFQNPSKLESIIYTGLTDNGNGTFTLTGCSRGQDGTTAQSWSAGDILFQAPRASHLNALELGTDKPWVLGTPGSDLNIYMSTSGTATPTNPLGGDPFDSIQSALAWASKYRWLCKQLVLNVAAGTYNMTAAVPINPNLDCTFVIRGAALNGNIISGMPHADFTNPDSPVTANRTADQLYNTAGQVSVTTSLDSGNARATDHTNNTSLCLGEYSGGSYSGGRWTTIFRFPSTVYYGFAVGNDSVPADTQPWDMPGTDWENNGAENIARRGTSAIKFERLGIHFLPTTNTWWKAAFLFQGVMNHHTIAQCAIIGGGYNTEFAIFHSGKGDLNVIDTVINGFECGIGSYYSSAAGNFALYLGNVSFQGGYAFVYQDDYTRSTISMDGCQASAISGGVVEVWDSASAKIRMGGSTFSSFNHILLEDGSDLYADLCNFYGLRGLSYGFYGHNNSSFMLYRCTIKGAYGRIFHVSRLSTIVWFPSGAQTFKQSASQNTVGLMYAGESVIICHQAIAFDMTGTSPNCIESLTQSYMYIPSGSSFPGANKKVKAGAGSHILMQNIGGVTYSPAWATDGNANSHINSVY